MKPPEYEVTLIYNNKQYKLGDNFHWTENQKNKFPLLTEEEKDSIIQFPYRFIKQLKCVLPMNGDFLICVQEKNNPGCATRLYHAKDLKREKIRTKIQKFLDTLKPEEIEVMKQCVKEMG